tara:strand:+ start:303 stop:551 length:249 start_codon:yes stop_codon:yes gene_type:complete
MSRLIDKIKPEVLRALERHCKPQYPTSHRLILVSLNSVKEYRDLTIEQVGTLLTFLPRELHPNGRVDFYFGDYLLTKKHQVK